MEGEGGGSFFSGISGVPTTLRLACVHYLRSQGFTPLRGEAHTLLRPGEKQRGGGAPVPAGRSEGRSLRGAGHGETGDECRRLPGGSGGARAAHLSGRSTQR